MILRTLGGIAARCFLPGVCCTQAAVCEQDSEKVSQTRLPEQTASGILRVFGLVARLIEYKCAGCYDDLKPFAEQHQQAAG